MCGRFLPSGKPFILILALVTLSTIQAAPVTIGMVSAVASNHLALTRDRWRKLSLFEGVVPSVSAIRELKHSSSSDVLAYVVEVSPHGFIVISSRTEIPPVIACSYLTDFSWAESNENELLDILRTDLRLRNKALDTQALSDVDKAYGQAAWDAYLLRPASLTVEQWPPEGYSSTTGWVNTSWDQFDPYNILCPREYPGGSRCVVGCVALAASMVVNYNSDRKDYTVKFHLGDDDKYVATAPGVTINIDDDAATHDFPTFEEMNVYLARLREKYIYNSALDDTDIATLNFACGIWDRMKYRSDGSQGDFPYKLCQVFVEKLGYSKARVIVGADYPVLSKNIKDSLPAVISILGTVVGNHIVVCDGLRETTGQPDQYHINFGWGPDTPVDISETWYALPILPLGYSAVEYCMLDLEPPYASLQPDNMVSLSAGNGFIGDGVYNKTAEGQSVGLALGGTSQKTYYVKIQNDGDRGSKMKVSLVKTGTANVSIKCFENDTELDITEAIAGSGWFTPLLDPAAESVIRIELTATNATGSCALDVFSEAKDDDAFTDMVRITTELGIEETAQSTPLTLEVPAVVRAGDITLSYTLPSSPSSPSSPSNANVSIAVFDASGRLVRNLKTEPGRFAAVWDACDSKGVRVPTGAYFVILHAGEGSRIAKIAVVR